MVETIQGRSLRVISTSKRIQLVSVQPDCTFEQLGIESSDRFNIVFDLESKFEIETDDEEAEKATKASDIAAGIQQIARSAGRSLVGRLTCCGSTPAPPPPKNRYHAASRIPSS
jgi:acyl carrier protein